MTATLRTSMFLIAAIALWGHVVPVRGADAVAGQRKANGAGRLDVYVELLGPAKALRGVAWPVDGTNALMSQAYVQQPCNLTVRLPSGREFQLPVMQATFTQDAETVKYISVVPLMDLVTYQGALDKIDEVVGALEIEPETRMPMTLALWRQYRRGTGMVHEGAETYLEEKAVLWTRYEGHLSQPGWFVKLQFNATSPEVMKLSRSRYTAEKQAEFARRDEELERIIKEREAEEELVDCSFELGGKIASFKPWPWSQFPGEAPFRVNRFQRAVATISLPGGAQLQLPVRIAHLGRTGDVITRAHLTARPRFDSVDDAVAEALKILQGWGMKPDQRLSEGLASWPELVKKPNYALPLRAKGRIQKPAPLTVHAELTRFPGARSWMLTLSLCTEDEPAD